MLANSLRLGNNNQHRGLYLGLESSLDLWGEKLVDCLWINASSSAAITIVAAANHETSNDSEELRHSEACTSNNDDDDVVCDQCEESVNAGIGRDSQ
jgi:hypothetical protein